VREKFAAVAAVAEAGHVYHIHAETSV